MEIEFGDVLVSETKFTGDEFVNLTSAEVSSESHPSLAICQDASCAIPECSRQS